MTKRFTVRHLPAMLCALGLMGTSSQAMASAFQLWEQDGASIANYHAGYAALIQDASTAFYNPAGLTRFTNQQVALGTSVIFTNFEYRGSVTLANHQVPIPPFIPETASKTFNSVTAQGGVVATVPSLNYVAPINDRFAFGFSVVVPFGLKTNYGSSTPLSYAATLTSITVVDISPSLAFKVTPKTSVGAGFDVQRVSGEFDNVARALYLTDSETTSTNKANGTGYGYHLGALYEFSENSRLGVSYHSQVVHHLSGSSELEGKIADEFNGGTMRSYATTRITLPAYTALSLYQRVNPQFALMGSVLYTQWNSFKNLTFNGISAVLPIPNAENKLETPTIVQVNVPEHYRNTWNFSVGLDYNATDALLLRCGLGYDQTPVRRAYRNPQLPDNNRVVAALGGHYQANRIWGFDLGWSHFFISQAPLSPPPLVEGAQVVSTDGTVTGGADVISGQITWTII